MQVQDIRNNRQRIRKQLKACFVIPQQTTSSQKNQTVDLKLQSPEFNIKNRSRRKTSLDIRQIDDITYLKQIYISNDFSDLFQRETSIGEGAQSVVYKCKEIISEQIYAVKVFRTSSKELINTIKKQYIILKSLDHENIIKGYYLFINEIQCKVHMVMEYCPYGTLRDYMKKHIFKEIQAAEIVGHILNALVKMHQNRVCHRDIKPQNILYNEATGELKIIDFEIAKMSKYEKNRVQMSTNTGTPHYKAPEINGGPYNQLVDVWSVGVILYELIVRKLPFNTDYIHDLHKIISTQQPDYSCPNLTSQCISFLSKLLAKNPLERISAKQALKTPFMLKFSSISSSSSPKMVRNGSQTDKKQLNTFQINVEKCLNQTDKLSGKQNLPLDIGIRFYQN